VERFKGTELEVFSNVAPGPGPASPEADSFTSRLVTGRRGVTAGNAFGPETDVGSTANR